MKTNQYQNIVFLTGAGISAPSGLATFRGSNGMWNNYPVEKIASIEGFRENPDDIHAFYNDLKPKFCQATPNNAHLAITDLQRHCLIQISVSSRKTLIHCMKQPVIEMSFTSTDG